MRKKSIKNLSGNYEEWLIESLREKEEAATFLQVALEEFQKDGDAEALLLSLRHVVEAQCHSKRSLNVTTPSTISSE